MVAPPQDSAEGASAPPSRRRVFAVAMAFVLLSCALAITETVMLAVKVANDTPAACGTDSCAFDGLGLFLGMAETVALLAVGTIVAGGLTLSRFRRSSRRRPVIVGLISAIPAIIWTALDLFGLLYG